MITGYLLLFVFLFRNISITESQCDETVENKIVRVKEETESNTVVLDLSKFTGTLKLVNLTPNFECFFNLTHQKLMLTKQFDADNFTDCNGNSILIKEILKLPAKILCDGSSLIDVLIELTQINDINPKFESSFFTAYFAENIPPNSTVFSFKNRVYDRDSVRPVILQIVNGNEEGYFEFNGQILVNKRVIDYEKTKNFQLTIKAKDQPPEGELQLSTLSQLTVIIIDQDDQYPQFSTFFHFATVLEEQKDRTKLSINPTIHAVDPDQGINATIYYGIITVKPRQLTNAFEIDMNTGAIYNIAPLDRESLDENIVYLNVKGYQKEDSNTRYSEIIVIVRVEDINDNAPTFVVPDQVSMPLFLNITENLSNGTVIFVLEAKDKDLESNAAIRYRISENIGNGFNINADNGEIFVANSKVLDREMNETISFKVYAEETGTNEKRKSKNLEIIITLQDVNDNNPVFTHLIYEFIVAKQFNSNEVIGQVSASDLDKGRNKELEYVMTSPLPSIVLDSSTGDIRLNDTPTDSTNQITFTVAATDKGDIQRSGLATVILYLNETTLFTILSGSNISQIYVSESIPVGTEIFQMQIQREMENSGISFSLTSQQNLSNFNMDTKGRLQVTSQLDYEHIKMYNISITIKSPILERSHLLIVHVLDSNDNYPMFTKDEYKFNIVEGIYSNTAVGNVMARDEDKSQLIKYQIINDDGLFKINGNNGVITVDGNVDREIVSKYILLVEARDSGTPSLSSVVNVTIMITDVNDNVPQVSGIEGTLRVTENLNKSDYIIAKLTVFDPDSNDSLTAQFRPATDLLNVQVRSRYIEVQTTNQSFDREREPIYYANLTFCDARPNCNVILLNVTVNDQNDNAPQIKGSNYNSSTNSVSVYLPINFKSGVTIGYVFAEDNDADANGKVVYSLSQNDVVKINSKTGMVTFIGSSKHLIMGATYEMELKIQDYGIPSLESQSTLKVIVIPENVYSPKFNVPRIVHLTVSENTAIRTVIFSFTVSDRDSYGNGITFSLQSLQSSSSTSNNNNNNNNNNNEALVELQVDGDRADVSLLRTLDYEVNSEFGFAITASDTHPYPKKEEIMIFVKVKDFNDNAPSFLGDSTTVVIPTSTAIYTVIAQLVAVDSDSGRNGSNKVTYSISGIKYFSVDSQTGHIKTVLPLPNKASLNTLVITATDQGSPQLSSVHFLRVNVLKDVSFHPMFQPSNVYSAYLVEESIGPILNVSAVLKENKGFVIYSISHISDCYTCFSLNPHSGTLSSVKKVNRNQYTTVRLRIIAANSINATLFHNTAMVTLTVTDINNNAPHFSYPYYYASIRENTPPPRKLFSVFVEDKDVHNQFYIHSSDKRITFRKGSLNFEYDVLLNEQLDYEAAEAPIIKCEATVTDGIFSSKGTFVIEILDANDETPYFQRNNYSFAVKENTLYSAFGKIQGYDKDVLDQNSLMYQLTNYKSTFFINETEGTLSNLVRLDYETKNQYFLNVTLKDKANHLISTIVTVNVLNVDEIISLNAAIFSIHTTEGNLSLGQSWIISISRTNISQYNFQTTSAFNQKLSIQHYGSGMINITSIVELDRDNLTEKVGLCTSKETFFIGLFPMNMTELLSYFKLDLYVNDTNDLAPQIDSADSLNIFALDNRPNKVIGQIKYKDRDCLGTISYHFINESTGQFMINSTSGEIRYTTIPNVNVDKFQLPFLVSDGIHNVTGEVTITLTDSNLNAPIFMNKTYIFKAKENYKGYIGQITATDSDSGLNGRIEYQLKSIEKFGEAFRINKDNGSIYLVENLDADTTDAVLITAIASDKGRKSKQNWTVIELLIEDVNDNKPYFLHAPYNAVIGENNKIGDLLNMEKNITVIDKDRTKTDFSFILSGPDSNFFSFDYDKRQFRAQAIFDYEKKTNYIFKFTVCDSKLDDNNNNNNDRLCTHTNVSVTITNLNDNGPQVISVCGARPADKSNAVGSTIFNVTLSETVDDQTYPVILCNISVVDLDWLNTNQSHPLFNIEPPNLYGINIHPLTGVIYALQAVDYEVAAARKLSFQITVSDNDYRPQPITTRITLNISLINLNDNNPIVHVAESVKIPEEINNSTITVNVTDLDDPALRDIQFNYAVMSKNFSKNITFYPSTATKTGPSQYQYVLVLSQSLDREMVAEFILAIQVTDKVTPIRMGKGQLKVQIQDSNDNAPQFEKNLYQFSIVESTKPGTVIGEIKATDLDISSANRDIKYSIRGNGSKYLSVSFSSGLITLVKQLQLEELITAGLIQLNVTSHNGTVLEYSPLQLIAVATDGVFTASSRIEIHILQLNLDKVTFKQSEYVFRVMENLVHGTVIGQVNAVVQGNSAVIQYKLSKQTYLMINPINGTVTVNRPLDREVTKRYEVIVEASTVNVIPRKTSVAMLTVNVIDDNDEVPQFEKEQYQFEATENNEPGAVIGFVMATDKDQNPVNSRIAYSVDEMHKDYFVMNNGIPGQILSRIVLDRENRTIYNFVVMARNTARPYHNSTVNVTVSVKDVNDNSPVIHVSRTEISIFEGEQPNKQLLQVTATDVDIIQSAFLKVVLLDPQNSTCCFVNYQGSDQSNSSINLLQPISSQTFSKIKLDVYAEDMGGRRSKTVSINIRVLKALPDFGSDNSTKKVSVWDSIQIHSIITTISAGPSIYQYTLRGIGSDHFTVDTKGQIMVIKQLNAAKISTFLLTLTAIVPGLTSVSTKVQIEVKPTNDAAPIFMKQLYQLKLRENTQDILLVDINTYDEMNHIAVEYSLIKTDWSFHFSINKFTGDIRVVQQIDREQVRSLTLIVVVQRNIVPAQNKGATATCSVLIDILDVNDNVPVVENNDKALFAVSSITPSNTPVYAIKASDPDIPSSSASLRFSMKALSDSYSSFLIIDSITGQISTIEAADHYLNKILTFQITVSDNFNKAGNLNSTVTIKAKTVPTDSFVLFKLYLSPSVWINIRQVVLNHITELFVGQINRVQIQALPQVTVWTESGTGQRPKRAAATTYDTVTMQGSLVAFYGIVYAGSSNTDVMPADDLFKLLNLSISDINNIIIKASNSSSSSVINSISKQKLIVTNYTYLSAIEISFIAVAIILLIIILILIVLAIILWKRRTRELNFDVQPTEMANADSMFKKSISKQNITSLDDPFYKGKESAIGNYVSRTSSNGTQQNLPSKQSSSPERCAVEPESVRTIKSNKNPQQNEEFDTEALDAVIASFGPLSAF